MTKMNTKLISKQLTQIYGIKREAYSEDERRTDLVAYFCTAIFLFGMLMGIVNTIQNEKFFAYFSFALSAFSVSAFIFMTITSRILFTEVLILTLVNSGGIYLLYSGGVGNAGHLWLFFIPTLSIFTFGLKLGSIFQSVMILIYTFLLYFGDGQFLLAKYEPVFKLRFVIAFFGVTVFSAAAEYSRFKANKKLAEKNNQLAKALREVKELHGLLPICASCKKIRNDQGYWDQIEVYIQEHSKADFSHGICPDCLKELYPEIYKMQEDEKDKTVNN